ncbi:hypothetical protein [Sphingobium phenoxybenzoativorans]|nr:hypothetical protein [Sphingobium phenoxybenzoativorans]
MSFGQVAGCIFAAIIVALFAVTIWLAGHGMETRDQWQQGDDE